MRQEERLPGLDELRGLAIGLVVLSHVGPVFGIGPASALLLAPAWSVGVDLFFVISGLVVEQSLRGLARERGALEAAAAFYVRRAMRIVPLAWCVAAALSFGLLFQQSGVQPADVRAAFAFLSNLHWAPCFGGSPGCGTVFAFGPFWSIATEMQFYVVAPLLVFTMSPRAIVGLAGLVLLAGMIMVRPWGGTLWTFRLDAIVVGLAIGTMMNTKLGAGLAVKLRAIGNAEATFWMTIAAFMMAILPAAAQSAATAILALLCGWIVLRATRRTDFVNAPGRMLRRLGNISYALYLVHLPVMAACSWLFARIAGVPATVAISIAAAVGLALVLTRQVGDPVRRLGRRWTIHRLREVSP